MFLGAGLRLSRRGQTGNDEVNAADRDIGHVLDGRLDVFLHLFGHSRDACAKGCYNFQSDLCRAVPHLYGDGRLDVGALEKVFHLPVLLAAGHLCHTLDLQRCTAGDLADDLCGDLQTAAFKLHVL